MRSKTKALATALALAASLSAIPAPAHAQLGTVRMDNWFFYQENYGDTARWQYRARFFVPYSFGQGWTFTQRLDLPFYYTDASGPGNPGGDWKGRFSDLFVEEILDTPDVAKNFRLRGSVRLVFPTGGESPFGNDQWQVAPGFGGNWRLPELWRGVTVAPYARYFYGFNEGAGVTTKRSWTLFPTVTFTMDPKWSMVFWPEQGITYNLRSGKWFVPIEAMATNRLSKQWEYSFGGSYAVNDNGRDYRWLAQGRLTYYFTK